MHDQFGDFIAKLTDNARISLQHAEAIARSQGSQFIGTEHVLLGVLAQGSSVGAKLLADAGVTLKRAEESLGISAQPLTTTDTVTRGLSETALLTLKMAFQQARDLQQEYLGTEHILYSLLRQKSARATTLLRDLDADVDQVIDELEAYFDRQSNGFGEMTREDIEQVASKKRRGGILDVYGADLTAKAEAGELDAVIGRESELERVITILSRRSKNNPILIGDPGVGKTAIAEGLAQLIVSGNVPEYLVDQKLIQLDLSGMVAGTKYRGEFEERLNRVVEEVKDQKNVILFIDEFHLLVGAGSAEGSMDAANILKPALARGQLRIIGATTFDEYRKRIETDTALERRLQVVVVKEPSIKETMQIIKGLKPYYEMHHKVSIDDEVLKDAVYLADRYIADRKRPDKAIDVVDEAAALTRVKNSRDTGRLRELRKESRQLEAKIEDAVTNEDYERAALYKMRLSRLAGELESNTERQPMMKLTSEQVARAIAMMTGIPVEKIHASERQLLKNLEKRLAKLVIGQKEAVEAVARAIRRGRSGIADKNRPIGSFVFMGPTGVGKTELARVLASEIFGSESALIKIDMSEFSEKHNTSRLVGAPAGYVGYEDGGKLTDKVRHQPYSVVLFDEIEKAHPDVFNLLLQLLEDGKLTDAKGREVDFSNTVIILTSNLGSDAMSRESRLGFQARTADDDDNLDSIHNENVAAARKALERFMRPELINRFDAVITFRALTRREITKIFNNMIANLESRLIVKGIGINVAPSARRLVIARGFDAKHGARPLRRTIEELIEHPIAEMIIAGKLTTGSVAHVRTDGDKIVITENNEE